MINSRNLSAKADQAHFGPHIQTHKDERSKALVRMRTLRLDWRDASRVTPTSYSRRQQRPLFARRG